MTACKNLNECKRKMHFGLSRKLIRATCNPLIFYLSLLVGEKVLCCWHCIKTANNPICVKDKKERRAESSHWGTPKNSFSIWMWIIADRFVSFKHLRRREVPQLGQEETKWDPREVWKLSKLIVKRFKGHIQIHIQSILTVFSPWNSTTWCVDDAFHSLGIDFSRAGTERHADTKTCKNM